MVFAISISGSMEVVWKPGLAGGLTSARLLAQQVRSPNLNPRDLGRQRRSRDLRIHVDPHVNTASIYSSGSLASDDDIPF